MWCLNITVITGRWYLVICIYDMIDLIKYSQVIYFITVTATGYPNPIYDVVIVYDYL